MNKEAVAAYDRLNSEGVAILNGIEINLRKTMLFDGVKETLLNNVSKLVAVYAKQFKHTPSEKDTDKQPRWTGVVPVEVSALNDMETYHALEKASRLSPHLAKMYHSYQVYGCDRAGNEAKDASCVIAMSETASVDNIRLCNLIWRDTNELLMFRLVPQIFHAIKSLADAHCAHNNIRSSSFSVTYRSSEATIDASDDFFLSTSLQASDKNGKTTQLIGGFSSVEYGAPLRLVLGDYGKVTYEARGCAHNTDIYDAFSMMTVLFSCEFMYAWVFNAERLAHKLIKVRSGYPAIEMALRDHRTLIDGKPGNHVDDIVRHLYEMREKGGGFLNNQQLLAIQRDERVRAFFVPSSAMLRFASALLRYMPDMAAEVYALHPRADVVKSFARGPRLSDADIKGIDTDALYAYMGRHCRPM